MSYANMILYSSVLPSYQSKKSKDSGKKGKDEDVIDADDPKNKELVKNALFG